MPGMLQSFQRVRHDWAARQQQHSWLIMLIASGEQWRYSVRQTQVSILSQKNIYFWFIDYAKDCECVDHNKLWKILKVMGIADHLTTSWEIYMQVKKQQLELDMEQWTGSILGKENVKAVYCHLAYLTYMQTTSCEMQGWMKHKLESSFPGETSITSYMQMTPPLWQKSKRN